MDLTPERLRELEQREQRDMRIESFEGLPEIKGSVRSPRIEDPDGVYSYELVPSGDSYIVYKDGIRYGTPARKGTRAFQSIEAVAKGGAPLPAKPKRSGSGGKGGRSGGDRDLPSVYDFSSLSPADLDKRMKNTLALAQGEGEALEAEKARRRDKAAAPAPETAQQRLDRLKAEGVK